MKTKKRKTFGNANSGTALRSLAEIGAMFGVSLQSIQCVEQRALKKIRAAIEREAASEGMSVRDWICQEE